MAATYHHARRLYIGTTAERAAVVLDVDGIGTDYWDTDVGVLYIWDGTAWVAGFAALPHSILSATHDDTTPAVVVRGDLMTGQGVAPLWQRLAHPGAANHVLQSTALEIGWSTQTLTLTGSLFVLAGTIIGGGGALNLGGFILTVPATGTAVIGGGAGAATRVAYWTDANTLASDAGLTYNAATDSLTAGDYFTTDGGQFGIVGNELLTVDAAGNFTFAGVTSVVVPDGCWVGADANCAWVYDLGNSVVTTLDKVGVGTPTPAGLLHAKRTGAGDVIIAETDTGNQNNIVVKNTLNAVTNVVFSFYLQNDTPASLLYAQLTADNVTRAAANEKGSFKFNVLDAGAWGTRMSIVGSVVTMSGYGAGDTQFLAGGVITSVSDKLLKRDIHNTESGLAEVLQMQGKSWRFTEESGLNDKDNTVYQGFIADDIEKIVPVAVGRDSKGMRTMSYSSLMPAFAEAFREIDTRLKKLEAQ